MPTLTALQKRLARLESVHAARKAQTDTGPDTLTITDPAEICEILKIYLMSGFVSEPFTALLRQEPFATMLAQEIAAYEQRGAAREQRPEETAS
jgi:hypothetical protein